MRIHRLIDVLLIKIVFQLLPVHSIDETFVLSGYLPEYRSYINLNATSIYLTDLIAFSVTPETIMSNDRCCLSSAHYDFIRKARSYKLEEKNEALRLLVTVGGAGRSNGFANIVGGTAQIQGKFADGLIKLCEKEGLDGIDLDYEGMQSTDEWKAYLKLIVRLGSRLHRHGLMLTVALHPGLFLPPKVCEVVDRVHVMTYDMLGGSNRIQGHHAELTAAQAVLEFFIDKGCPSSKLILGIPAYARNGQNPGLVKTYSEIIDDYFTDDQLMKNDFRKIGMVNGYYFDSPVLVAKKVKYAKSIGLGGVFVWEIGQDKQFPGYSGGILLHAAAEQLTSNPTREEL